MLSRNLISLPAATFARLPQHCVLPCFSWLQQAGAGAAPARHTDRGPFEKRGEARWGTSKSVPAFEPSFAALVAFSGILSSLSAFTCSFYISFSLSLFLLQWIYFWCPGWFCGCFRQTPKSESSDLETVGRQEMVSDTLATGHTPLSPPMPGAASPSLGRCRALAQAGPGPVLVGTSPSVPVGYPTPTPSAWLAWIKGRPKFPRRQVVAGWRHLF